MTPSAGTVQSMGGALVSGSEVTPVSGCDSSVPASMGDEVASVSVVGSVAPVPASIGDELDSIDVADSLEDVIEPEVPVEEDRSLDWSDDEDVTSVGELFGAASPASTPASTVDAGGVTPSSEQP